MNLSKPFRAVVSDAQIRAWRWEGYTVEKMAEATGMRTSEILARMQRIYAVPRAIDPDEETIQKLCAEIQAEWSEEERMKRLVGSGASWTPTVVPASVVASARSLPAGCDAPPASTLTCAQS